MLSMQL